MTEIREFEREHLEDALALFTAAGWETYFEDPVRTERVLYMDTSAPPRASTATWAPNRRPAFD
jgi:hypothetical protein